MPYALRNRDGTVTSLHLQPEPGAEFLPDAHPEVQRFVDGSGTGGFGKLDADLVRVIEDLVDVLIERRVIRITDLPPEAKEKLFARKSFRERRSPKQTLRLYAGDDGMVINTDFVRI